MLQGVAGASDYLSVCYLFVIFLLSVYYLFVIFLLFVVICLFGILLVDKV